MHHPRLALEFLDGPDPRLGALPGTRSGAPLFTGSGNVDYVCARCGRVLCRNMRPGELLGLVFSCSGCAGFNRVPGP